MSSRLLTMKFMQRAAAASSPANSPNQPPSKRQRMSNGTSTPRHSTSDVEAVQAALAEEERKLELANERHAAEVGETKWVLSVREPKMSSEEAGLDVTAAGFAEIDALEDVDDSEEDEGQVRPRATGRMRFGKFSKPTDETDESSDSSDEDEEDYDPNDLDQIIAKASRGAKSPNSKASKTSAYTAPKSDRINFTSISGGGGSAGKRGQFQGACYKCGRIGHAKANCPENVHNLAPYRRHSGRPSVDRTTGYMEL